MLVCTVVFRRDSGKEYACLDRTADALQLVSQMRALDDAPGLVPATLQCPHSIVRALPYNAAAKAIEPMFRVLERGFFSNLPGWIGGDRMAKKTANVGREPIPYPHGRQAFLADLRTCMNACHATPQPGELDGRTPNEAFDAAVDAGWQRMDIARGALLAAFGKDEFRTLRQGSFRYESRWYTHPALQELGADRRLHLRIPPFGDLPEIPVMDACGRELLCMAAADRRYDVLDPEGAREAGRRVARARAGVAKLRADTDPVDVLEAEARRAGEGFDVYDRESGVYAMRMRDMSRCGTPTPDRHRLPVAHIDFDIGTRRPNRKDRRDRVDDAGEAVQLRPPHRLGLPIPRGRRIAQHLVHRPTVDPEPATGLVMAQSLLDNCQSYRCVKLHPIHPPAPAQTDKGASVAQFCAAATGPTGRFLWNIIPPPLTILPEPMFPLCRFNHE